MAKRPRKRMDDPSNWGPGGGRRRKPDDAARFDAPPAYDADAVSPPIGGRRGTRPGPLESEDPGAGREPASAPGQDAGPAASGPPAEDTFEGWLDHVPRGFAVPSRDEDGRAEDEGPPQAATPQPPPRSWRDEVPEGFAVPPAPAPDDAGGSLGAGAGGRSATGWDADFEWTAPREPRPVETQAAEETAPGAWKEFTAARLPAADEGPTGPDEESPTPAPAAGSPGSPCTGDEPPAGAPGWRHRVDGSDAAPVDAGGRRDAGDTSEPGGAGPRGPRSTYRRHGRSGDGPDGRRLAPAGKVLLALVIGLGLAALLSAQDLQRQAESMHVGTARSIAMALVRPVTAISSTLRFDELRAAVEDALGRGARERAGVHTRTPDPTQNGQGSGSSSGGSGSSKPSVSPSAVIFTPTKDKKLALWVGGDSMAMTFGESVVAMADRTGVIETALDYHVSSGLSRPDFFNWPRRLRAEMKAFRPDVVVFASGANDGQDVQHEGTIHYYGSKEWVDLYRERVAVAMNIAGGGLGRPVWWVGMPIARDPAQSAIYRTLNKVYKEEARTRPNVRYVDTYSLFSDANGGYSDYLTGRSGKKELMRQGDGIHWSRAGSDLVAARVMEQIAELYKFKFTP